MTAKQHIEAAETFLKHHDELGIQKSIAHSTLALARYAQAAGEDVIACCDDDDRSAMASIHVESGV